MLEKLLNLQLIILELVKRKKWKNEWKLAWMSLSGDEIVRPRDGILNWAKASPRMHGLSAALITGEHREGRVGTRAGR